MGSAVDADRQIFQLLLEFAATLTGQTDARTNSAGRDGPPHTDVEGHHPGRRRALQTLVHRSTEVLDVEGIGVMLLDERNRLSVIATSDAAVGRIEEAQIGLDDGPCVDALRTGRVVVVPDLATDDRYPRLGPLADGQGVRGVLSVPMRAHDTTIGAMNLYRSSVGRFDDGLVQLARLFADTASAHLVSAARTADATTQLAGIRRAMTTHGPVEQAKGAIMHSVGLTDRQAFDLLRQHARRTRASLSTVVRAFLVGELTLEDLGWRSAPQRDGQVAAE